MLSANYNSAFKQRVAQELASCRLHMRLDDVRQPARPLQPRFVDDANKLLPFPFKPSSHTGLHRRYHTNVLGAREYVALLQLLYEEQLMGLQEYQRCLHEVYSRGEMTDTEYLTLRKVNG